MIAPDNPWMSIDLAGPGPYVFSGDVAAIAQFQRLGKSGHQQLHTSLLPEPFVGDLAKCRILILLNNPGFREDDKLAHRDDGLRAAIARNIRCEEAEYPLIYLDPQFAFWPGAMWWVPVLAPIVREVATKKRLSMLQAGRLVAGAVAGVERYPYHSQRSSSHGLLATLPSFAFTKGLVDAALERGAIPVLLWRSSENAWLRQVPAIARSKFIAFRSGVPFARAIGPDAIGQKDFARVVSAIVSEPGAES